MKRSALLLLGLLASFAAQAQIYEYKDAAGKTVYTDQPPVGMAVKPRTVSSTVPPDVGVSPAQLAADRELEQKRTRQAQKETTDKAQKEAVSKAAVKDDCARARKQLQLLESGERIAERDENGERVYMEGPQRTSEIERTRKFITESCK